MTKPKIALIRGQFLNRYDMQNYEPLIKKYDITAFGSLHPMHKEFAFPVELLVSPTDIPDFPKKMSILNRIFVDAQYLWGLEKELKGFEIAHTAETYYHYTHQALVAKRKGYVKKVVTTVWENIPRNNEGILGRKWFKQSAKEHVDHFIAVSEASKKALLEEGVAQEKISIIQPGINTNLFAPVTGHFEKISAKKKDITILFVGRLEIYKGVFDILEAASSLKRDTDLKKYHISYIFSGSGAQKENMQVFAKSKGLEKDILYVTAGYNNMPEIYQMADIFVAPSKKDRYWQEQYGMMLVEAQAAGLPIVTTHSGSIPENVEDSAVLVQEGNVKQLAQALKAFILSPKLRLIYARKARIRAEKVHDSLQAAQKIHEVYQHVLGL